MTLGRAALVVALVVLAAGAPQVFPAVTGDPNVPHDGGTITQSNMTGRSFAVAILSNDDIMVAGSTVSVTTVGTAVTVKPVDGFLLRYSSSGAFSWKLTHDFGQFDVINSLVRDSGNRLFGGGFTITVGESHAWGRAFEFSPTTGSQIWATNFSISGVDATQIAELILDGDDLIVVGQTRTANGTGYPIIHPFIAKFTKGGSVVTSTHFTSIWSEAFTAVSPGDTAGSYFVAGSSSDDGTPNRCIRKVTFSGVTWAQCDEEFGHFLGMKTHSGAPVGGGIHVEGPPAVNNINLVRRESDGDLIHTVDYDLEAEQRSYGAAVVPLGTADILTATRGAWGVDTLGASLRFDLLEQHPDIVSVKFASGGTVAWDAIWSTPSYSYFAGDAALDSEPRLVIVGAVLYVPLLVVSVHPYVLIYEDL